MKVNGGQCCLVTNIISILYSCVLFLVHYPFKRFIQVSESQIITNSKNILRHSVTMKEGGRNWAKGVCPNFRTSLRVPNNKPSPSERRQRSLTRNNYLPHKHFMVESWLRPACSINAREDTAVWVNSSLSIKNGWQNNHKAMNKWVYTMCPPSQHAEDGPPFS